MIRVTTIIMRMIIATIIVTIIRVPVKKLGGKPEQLTDEAIATPTAAGGNWSFYFQFD